MGGQTALNVAMELAETGVLDKYGVELIGAKARAITVAEDREEFARRWTYRARRSAGPHCAHVGRGGRGGRLHGLPGDHPASFTLGGPAAASRTTGKSTRPSSGADWRSPRRQVLIERSLLGWKEFELEVMRDYADNVVIVCSIENLDPMGVHTGDSITVAPAMTLTDREYQVMRDAACRRDPRDRRRSRRMQHPVRSQSADGEMVVIEMNPRVSRSSALASKATGFPIARIGPNSRSVIAWTRSPTT